MTIYIVWSKAMIFFPIAGLAVMVAGCGYGVYLWSRYARRHPLKK